MLDTIQSALNLQLPFDVVLLRLLMAALLGAALGWERQHMDKPAGLRTYMLVALGSAGYVLLANEMASAGGSPHGNSDPARIAQGLAQGLGFLGAGTIIQSRRGGVHGLTTAAGIWVGGAIGACCGAGLYGLAILMTGFVLFILIALLRVELTFFPKTPHPPRPPSL
jgi:putative Mg2+ transporter-C (MgtC) family protein